MTNNRPLLIFIGAILVLGAAFWGLLQFASRHNDRLAAPQPKQTVAQESAHNSDQHKETPSPAPQPSTPPPASSRPTPPATPPAAQKPHSASPAPTPTPAPPAVHPGAVPATGASTEIVATSVFIGLAAFLTVKLRRQNAQLRFNR